MDELLAEFLTETNENLLDLETALVRLEAAMQDDATLSAVFRLVHTIKGTCGFLGLSRLERLAHAAENTLGKMRDGTLAPSPEIVSLILDTLDQVKAILAGLGATGAEPTGNDDALISALTAAGRNSHTPLDRAPSLGLVTGSAADLEPTMVTARETVRVNVDILENLMALARELVLTRNQMLQLSRAEDGGPADAALQRLSRITSELQEGVAKARMQPIGNAWRKLPRMVRDLARELSKQIELVLNGTETELDRQILEFIRDPLTHMVRNSADHGLEPPAERRARGKPEAGRITLAARHQGSHVVIEVSDDGRGLSIEKIRAKAIANGIATESEIAHMTEGQIQRFIFHPGFSTASAVTSVSGRGVGMDVVKTNVERLGGTIDVNSIIGKGTSLTIRIPLTLAIISALIVEASGERFAIPQVSILELVHAGAKGTANIMIECIDDARMLRLRQSLIPLIGLAELLKLEASTFASDTSVIVVAQVGSALIGLMVDKVFDIEEIVVKPAPPILHHVTMFGGSTILGDGEVIMILDPNGIARASGINVDHELAPAKVGAAEYRSGPGSTPMLLFRAGKHGVMAVPLGLLTRIESLAQNAIEHCGDLLVTQCRGRLMPLISISTDVGDTTRSQPVLVFAGAGRTIGLVVDEIIDIVEDTLEIELTAARPGLIGTAVVGGRAADILDTEFWLTCAWPDLASHSEPVRDAHRVLAIDASEFSRQFLAPSLAAAGYRVTTAPSTAEALDLRDSGEQFDAILFDMDVPDADGLVLAEAARSDPRWATVPIIALSAHAHSADDTLAQNAGLDGHIAKFNREALLASLKQCLASPLTA